MKVVILAGGLGTRLREETEFKPKPMVEIGGQPLLWHLMQSFIAYGLNDFIIAAGYKSNFIKQYFLNFEAYGESVELEFKSGSLKGSHSSFVADTNFRVKVIDTGYSTNTGERLKMLREAIGNKTFICTYGDGLANIEINHLLDFHQSHKKIATVTAVRPRSRFGQLEISSSGIVTNFREKPFMDDWVNGGFFCFEPEFLEYVNPGDSLEAGPLNRLIHKEQLAAYRHTGFWYAMDTYREFLELNQMWDRGEMPWLPKQTS